MKSFSASLVPKIVFFGKEEVTCFWSLPVSSRRLISAFAFDCEICNLETRKSCSTPALYAVSPIASTASSMYQEASGLAGLPRPF